MPAPRVSITTPARPTQTATNSLRRGYTLNAKLMTTRRMGMTAMTAMKSTLEAEDLAGACVFFASDDAKFVTGQTLVIDGGLAMPA